MFGERGIKFLLLERRVSTDTLASYPQSTVFWLVFARFIFSNLLTSHISDSLYLKQNLHSHTIRSWFLYNLFISFNWSTQCTSNVIVNIVGLFYHLANFFVSSVYGSLILFSLNLLDLQYWLINYISVFFFFFSGSSKVYNICL